MRGSCLTSKRERGTGRTGLSAVSQERKTVNCKVEGEESHALTLKGNRRHRDQPEARLPVQ